MNSLLFNKVANGVQDLWFDARYALDHNTPAQAAIFLVSTPLAAVSCFVTGGEIHNIVHNQFVSDSLVNAAVAFPLGTALCLAAGTSLRNISHNIAEIIAARRENSIGRKIEATANVFG